MPKSDSPEISLDGTETRYSRVQMAGTGANYTIGSWLDIDDLHDVVNAGSFQ